MWRMVSYVLIHSLSTPCAIDDDDSFLWVLVGDNKSEALGKIVLAILGNDLLEFEEAGGLFEKITILDLW